MRKRSGKPKGPFSVQVIKGEMLSNILANRLNDYRHQFPRREIVAVSVLEIVEGDMPPAQVVYEVIWEEPPK